jgi:hypothetical protein
MTLEGHQDHITALRVLPTGAGLYSCSRDHTIVQWNAASGAVRCGRVSCTPPALSQDAIARGVQRMATVSDHLTASGCLAISADGKYLFWGNEGGSISQWNTESEQAR